MNLPYVRISFQNGQLGLTEPTADGVCGLIPDGAVVVNNYLEHNGAAYLITSLSDVTVSGTDALTYEMIREFFDEAGDGAYLWILNAKPTTSAAGITSLQTLSGGACRAIAVTTPLGSSGTVTAIQGLEAAVEDLEEDLYAPVLVVAGIKAPTTPGNAVDITLAESSHVAVVCGNELTGVTATDALLDDAAAVGLLLGRIAKTSVQTSVARVSDGAMKASTMTFGTDVVTLSSSSALSTKGYIVPRTWTGKAGFFWSSDCTATGATDDYGLIPRRRTIDKAFRITYQTLVEQVGMQIPVTSDGTIPTTTAKSIEAAVETALERGMANAGNLGADPDDDTDNGIKVYVDPSQNVVSTNKIVVDVKVKPYGYAYYLEANLSFYTTD